MKSYPSGRQRPDGYMYIAPRFISWTFPEVILANLWHRIIGKVHDSVTSCHRGGGLGGPAGFSKPTAIVRRS